MPHSGKHQRPLEIRRYPGSSGFSSSCWKKVSTRGPILEDITKAACPAPSNATPNIKINNWELEGKRENLKCPRPQSLNQMYIKHYIFAPDEMIQLSERKVVSTSGICPHLLQVSHRVYSTRCCVIVSNVFYSQNIGKLWLWEAPLEFMQTQLSVVYGSFHRDGKNHPADPE